MLYHEPALCNLLDQYDVVPELYAMQWFLTLFARTTVSIEVLLRLWDFLFVHGDPVLVYFVALAFLRSKRCVASGLPPSVWWEGASTICAPAEI